MGDPLEVLARVGVEQLAGLGVVAVAVDPRDPLVPWEHRERVQVGHRRQLGLLGAEADVVAVAVGEEVGGRAVDELVAARDATCGKKVDTTPLPITRPVTEICWKKTYLMPCSSIRRVNRLDPLGASGGVACLLERRRRRLDPIAREHGRDGPAEHLLGRDRRFAGGVNCHSDLLSSFALG